MDSQSLADPVELIYDRRVRGALIVSVADGQNAHIHGGCWLAVAGLRPARLMAAIPKEFRAAAMIEQLGRFTVAVASREDQEWQGRFYHGDLAVVNDSGLFARSPAGAPVPARAVGYVDFRLIARADLGDFLLVVGEAVSGGLLNPGAQNLTVNEIVAEEDPRGREETVLPFAAFPYHPQLLPPARSTPSPFDDRAFLDVVGRRHWGVYLAATAAGGVTHLMVSGWGIQASHRPASLVLAARAASPVVSLWREPGAEVLLSFLSAQDRPLVEDLAAAHAGQVPLGAVPTDGGLYRSKQALATFQGRASVLIEQGNLVIAKVVVERAEEGPAEDPNLCAEEVDAWLGRGGHLDPGLTYPAAGGH